MLEELLLSSGCPFCSNFAEQILSRPSGFQYSIKVCDCFLVADTNVYFSPYEKYEIKWMGEREGGGGGGWGGGGVTPPGSVPEFL